MTKPMGITELQQAFDLRWKADMRAIKMWQVETGETLVWPDHEDLCVWLLNLIDRYRAEAADAIEDIDSPDPVKQLASHLAISCIANSKMIPLGDGRWTKAKRAARGSEGGHGK